MSPLFLGALCFLGLLPIGQATESSIERSDKLSRFIQKVEKETGRPVRIEFNSKMGLMEVDARFVPHPTYIRVLLRDTLKVSDPQVEQLVAHEIAHGFLIYARGYAITRKRENATEIDGQIADLLGTFISDIPVHKVVEQEGFEIFSPKYLDNVQAEIRTAQMGQNIYEKRMGSEVLGRRLAVLRSILAWSFLEYFSLNAETRSTLESFLAVFEKAYPSEARIAAQFKRILRSHNIFTPQGHRKALAELLKLWRLGEVTELITLSEPR